MPRSSHLAVDWFIPVAWQGEFFRLNLDLVGLGEVIDEVRALAEPSNGRLQVQCSESQIRIFVEFFGNPEVQMICNSNGLRLQRPQSWDATGRRDRVLNMSDQNDRACDAIIRVFERWLNGHEATAPIVPGRKEPSSVGT